MSNTPEPTPTPTLARLGDLLEEWERDAAAAHLARENGAPRGPVSGLPTLDLNLGGAFPPGVHILHGTPGSGKTAFSLQAAGSCACPALYLSVEMSRLELFRRVTARVTSTFLGKLKTGELPPAESVALARRAAAACPNLALADATQAFASPTWLREAAKAARGDAEHVLIVVDSVHSWADSAPSDAPEYEALNAALAALRSLASALPCAVLAVCERNRASMRVGGLNAGAGSRKIEYGAETVLDLTRDPDDRPDTAGEVPVTLTFSKNRNGPAGKKVELRFHGAFQRFREVPR